MIIECNVAHIGLHLLESKGNSVVVVVFYSIVRRELDEVKGFELHDSREKVSPLQREVLNDEVQGFIRILHARYGNVANFFNQCWQYNFADIIPEIRLELERAFAIEEKILGQVGPIFAELFVELFLLLNHSENWKGI